MRKLIVSEFITLDGVMEDPGGSEGKTYGGWSLKFFSPEYMTFKAEELFACDALLLGRLTYQEFADSWPQRESKDDAFAHRMNSIKKYLVSTTTETADWTNTTIIKDNLVDTVRQLKNETGQDILVAGSSQLLDTLMKHGLVDELRLMIHPIAIGEGKHLFKDHLAMSTFELTDSKVFSTGTVVLTYKPDRNDTNK